MKSLTYQIVSSILIFTVLTLPFGCGGSTSGTGGVTVEGRVLEANNTPLTSALVTVIETGDTAITDSSGNFTLETDLSSTLSFLIESEEISAQSQVNNLPNDTKKLIIQFKVDRSENSASSEVKEIQRADDNNDSGENESSGSSSSSSSASSNQPGGSNSSISSDQSGNQNSSSNDSDDDDENDDSVGSDEDSSSSSSSSSEDNQDSEDNKEKEAEGLISVISPASVTIGSLSFIPNAQSEYRDLNGKQTTLSYFKVGDFVKAKGEFSDGVLLLLKLEAKEND